MKALLNPLLPQSILKQIEPPKHLTTSNFPRPAPYHQVSTMLQTIKMLNVHNASIIAFAQSNLNNSKRTTGNTNSRFNIYPILKPISSTHPVHTSPRVSKRTRMYRDTRGLPGRILGQVQCLRGSVE